jgi:orotidine-5'-phosphate decarboxylase
VEFFRYNSPIMTHAAHFGDRLAAAVRRRGNAVVVGLDPRWEQLPPGFTADGGGDEPPVRARAFAEFCKGVIDAVAPLVPAVKPQAACFEQAGAPGMIALADVIRHAQRAGLLVIIDGKRNDIGSTAEAYAEGLLGPGESSPWGGDALTVSPYLGDDSVRPFVEVARERGAGLFVLVKTSNPGGVLFQDLVCDGKPLYRHVAAWVEGLAAESAGASGYGIVGAVVGATYPAQLAELRAEMPHAWFLVPGYGSQGGTAADVAPAFNTDGLGAVINNSRGIIFAHSRSEYRGRFAAGEWQMAVEAATRDMIAALGDRP